MVRFPHLKALTLWTLACTAVPQATTSQDAPQQCVSPVALGHVTLPSVPVSMFNKLKCLLIHNTDNTMIQLKFGPTRYCVEWTVSRLVIKYHLLIA